MSDNSQQEVIAEGSSSADWHRINLLAFAAPSPLAIRSRIRANLWRLIGLPLLRHSPCGISGGRLFNAFRASLLRVFGARVGRNTTIMPCEIHSPWNVSIGENTWIGEAAWLYALEPIIIGKNVCISQRAFLCTGSHDMSDAAFGLVKRPIHVKDGAWVCACAFVGPGVTLHAGAVLGANSTTFRDLPAMTVWSGNPCAFSKPRVIKDKHEPAIAA